MFKLLKWKFILGLLMTALLIWGGCANVKVLSNKKELNKQSSIKAPKPKKTALEKEEEFEAESKASGTTYVAREKRKKKISDFCKKIDKRFKKYGWGKSKCETYPWNFVRTSVQSDPLIWMNFGDDSSSRKETTIILCGVHGDEITPIKFCFDILNHLNNIVSNKNKNHSVEEFKNRLIIVAPIVNPDSFFKKWPSRTNANGVDVNRNFPTRDFKATAMKIWKNRYRKDKRRFPGTKAMSEPETLFQVNLLKRYGPDKIISVHAPLTMLDYDGPADRHSGGVVGSSANQLLIQMSEQAKGYKIKNYPFFPGSLGNYAGNERNIPTYTLELPSSDNRKSKKFWNLFKDSIHSAIMHKMGKEGDVVQEKTKASSNIKQN
jgi:protein MpaA